MNSRCPVSGNYLYLPENFPGFIQIYVSCTSRVTHQCPRVKTSLLRHLMQSVQGSKTKGVHIESFLCVPTLILYPQKSLFFKANIKCFLAETFPNFCTLTSDHFSTFFSIVILTHNLTLSWKTHGVYYFFVVGCIP